MGAKKIGVVAAETMAPPAGDCITSVEDINLPKQRKISKEQLGKKIVLNLDVLFEKNVFYFV